MPRPPSCPCSPCSPPFVDTRASAPHLHRPASTFPRTTSVMAAENLAPRALPPPLSMPAPSSRPERDPSVTHSPSVLAAPVGLGAPPVTRPSSHQQQYDPSLDPAIKQLLDQQAEIQARLATLLPQKYGPNVKVELDMLRHKFRVLRAYADDHREPPFFLPYPSSSLCRAFVQCLFIPLSLALSLALFLSICVSLSLQI